MNIFNNSTFNLFTTILASIIFEAIPFLLLGTFLSSFIEVFVSEKFFEKYIPSNRFLALLMATFIGLVFPVCECAIIPVAARLIKKGVPVYFACAFILAVPTINIPVMLSTYYAFSGQVHIFILRIICGGLVANIIGLALSFYGKEKKIIRDAIDETHCCEKHDDHAHDVPHELSPIGSGKDSCELQVSMKETAGCPDSEEPVCIRTKDARSPDLSVDVHSRSVFYMKIKSKIGDVFEHTVEEFFETGKYLLFGAIIASLFQSLVPRSILTGVSDDPLLSSMVLSGIAYVLSICSQTDAFVARSFLGQFPQGAIVGFMVVGAMIDVKSTAMLGRVFKKKFTIVFIVMIFTIGLIAATAITIILGA